MTKIEGYDGRFALRCWPVAAGGAPAHEACGDDPAALRATAGKLLDAGVYGHIELSVWNFELNDWVRMETFGKG